LFQPFFALLVGKMLPELFAEFLQEGDQPFETGGLGDPFQRVPKLLVLLGNLGQLFRLGSLGAHGTSSQEWDDRCRSLPTTTSVMKIR
jgi:hypothetical protein